jgi:hypothetical protein
LLLFLVGEVAAKGVLPQNKVTRSDRRFALKGESPVFHNHIKRESSLVMFGAWLIGVIDTPNESDWNWIRRLHVRRKLSPMRLYVRNRQVQLSGLSVVLVGEKQVTKQSLLGRVSVLTDAFLNFGQIVSHEGRFQGWIYPYILRRGSADVFGADVKPHPNAIAVVDQRRIYSNFNIYPRAVSISCQRQLLVEYPRLLHHLTPHERRYNSVCGDCVESSPSSIFYRFLSVVIAPVLGSRISYRLFVIGDDRPYFKRLGYFNSCHFLILFSLLCIAYGFGAIVEMALYFTSPCEDFAHIIVAPLLGCVSPRERISPSPPITQYLPRDSIEASARVTHGILDSLLDASKLDTPKLATISWQMHFEEES